MVGLRTAPLGRVRGMHVLGPKDTDETLALLARAPIESVFLRGLILRA